MAKQRSGMPTSVDIHRIWVRGTIIKMYDIDTMIAIIVDVSGHDFPVDVHSLNLLLFFAMLLVMG